MLTKLFVAVLAATFLVVVPTPSGAVQQADCNIVSPPEGWPGGGNPGYNTRLHLGHNNDWPNQLRPIGDVKAIMLFVDFPNAGATETTTPYYNNLVPGATQFFNTVSYGQFRLTVDAPSRWYRMSKNHQDYGMGYIVSPAVQAVYIDEAMRLADNDVDFSKYSAVYVVPVRTASGMPFSPEWNDYRGVVVHDGKVFKNGVTFGQDAWSWGYKITNHETGHDMGLPEDYNATGSGPTFKFTGDWGVMGNIAAEGPDFFAWEKWKMGWLTDSQVACVSAPTTVTLSPLATASGTKMIVVRTGVYTAFIAELRQRMGVDGNACDKGLLVYKLDAALPNGSGNIRVQDSHPNSGVCGEPLNDAPYDLGTGEVSTFYDAASQTRFEVLSAGTDYVVRVTVPSTSVPVWSDDFSTDRGWTVGGAATSGRWARGIPVNTSYSGTTCQLSNGTSALATGLAGGDCGAADVDGGTTTATSPGITLPAASTLKFDGYLAHLNNASSADYLRLRIGSTVLWQRTASASNVSAAWTSVSVDLSAYAGQTIQLVFEAVDSDPGSLVEAAIDNINITRS